MKPGIVGNDSGKDAECRDANRRAATKEIIFIICCLREASEHDVGRSTPFVATLQLKPSIGTNNRGMPSETTLGTEEQRRDANNRYAAKVIYGIKLRSTISNAAFCIYKIRIILSISKDHFFKQMHGTDLWNVEVRTEFINSIQTLKSNITLSPNRGG